MNDLRLSLPAVALIAALVGGGAFAAGRAIPSAPAEPAPMDEHERAPARAAPREDDPNDDPHGGAMGGQKPDELPPGHPAIDPNTPPMAAAPTDKTAGAAGSPSLSWKAPARWQLVPSASSMRMATYKIPKAPGDSEDGELSVMQAGGTVDANADRWVGQFDAASQKTAKRSTKTVGSLPVTIVEVQGNYSGGMMMAKPGASGPAGGGPGWALLGAIVSTPSMPHFFKLTGPVKTVNAARGEFDAFVASFAPKT